MIVVSSVDDPRKGYALGADAYLQKPVTAAALLDDYVAERFRQMCERYDLNPPTGRRDR